MTITYCLDCECVIELGVRPRVEQKVICSSCGTKFEVINLEPPELDWTYEGPTTNSLLFDEPREVKRS